ncbi:DUF992 domain-containing protein [Aurantimonas sp. Leaf443]|uniref:DUF992 domain-containing protein n=1 Tax=Aurantimonas sp. Leaf443 TaxID=1736378 RepID=UPI0006F410E0|nr:DUF992 domain-containing protein [Aurantimonas sp. Leaf443]KQT85942.1 hypothetical protein ASG48_04915 [Aurantimonas sp. Leaf443]
MKTLPSLAFALLAALPLGMSEARAATSVGVLGCHGDGTIGLVLGSREKLVCEFTPYGGGPVELYTAQLDTVGIDLGATGRTAMTWAVVSVNGRQYQPTALGGTYVGASADASAIVGGGGSILVGGDLSSFSLQPLSVRAQEGINAAVGVSRFTLTPAVASAAPVAPAGVALSPAGNVPLAPPSY